MASVGRRAIRHHAVAGVQRTIVVEEDDVVVVCRGEVKGAV